MTSGMGWAHMSFQGEPQVSQMPYGVKSLSSLGVLQEVKGYKPSERPSPANPDPIRG